MVKRNILLSLITLLLTGCPGEGDRLRPDEEGTISVINNEVCFPVPDSKNYKLSILFVNPRGIPYQEENIIFDPAIDVKNEQLCIPPSFYRFNSDGQFYIKATFTSLNNAAPSRCIVSALEVKQGKIGSIRPNDREILRPYSERLKGE